MHHPEVVQSPVFNDCMNVNIYCHNKLKIVPKLLLKVSVRELPNSLVSNPIYCGLKEARDVENNIIINDSTLH